MNIMRANDVKSCSIVSISVDLQKRNDVEILFYMIDIYIEKNFNGQNVKRVKRWERRCPSVNETSLNGCNYW